MSQLLIVSPCPNCGTDAGQHNKVLYDGIFLICHNCGYGWYYNIEVTNLEKATSYNSKSMPLNTLHNINNIKKVHNINKHKNNLKTNRVPLKRNVKNTEHHNNIKKHNTQDNYSNNLASNTNKQPQNSHHSPQPISYDAGDYTNNVYYTPTESYNNSLSSTYTKPQSSYQSSTPNESIKSHYNKPNKSYNNNLNTNNIKQSSVSNEIKPENKNSVTTNKNKPISKVISINSPTNNSTNSSNNTVINLSKLPNKKIRNSNSEKERTSSKTEPRNHNKPIEQNTAKNNSIVNSKINSEQGDLKSKLPNNIPNNNLNISTSINKSNKININLDSNNKNAEKNNIPECDNDVKTNINLPNDAIHKDTATTKSDINEINEDINNSLSFNNLTENNTPNNNLHLSSNIAALKKEHIAKAKEEFNNIITDKTNLGLDSSQLLQLEEKTQYNIKEYARSPVTLSSVIPDFKSITNNIKSGIIFSYKSFVTLFTRLDLLLRFLAYSILIIGSIAFLYYLNYKKHNKIDQNDNLNTSYNNESNSENNNDAGYNQNSKRSDTNTLKQSSSISQSETNNSATNDQNNIIAYEKQYNNKQVEENPDLTINNLSKIDKNGIKSTMSLMDKVKKTINNSTLAFKQVQKNAFSNIKVFQNYIKWQGEYNNTLISNIILSNIDKSSSYLVKSIEVVFLENSGNVIGKRIIITNQLINHNSAIELNLKINNPPNETSKVFVYIKDKVKL